MMIKTGYGGPRLYNIQQSDQNPDIRIPRLNGVKSTQCVLRTSVCNAPFSERLLGGHFLGKPDWQSRGRPAVNT